MEYQNALLESDAEQKKDNGVHYVQTGGATAARLSPKLPWPRHVVMLPKHATSFLILLPREEFAARDEDAHASRDEVEVCDHFNVRHADNAPICRQRP